tara:strand:+ start:1968 stop:2324 length:357 start_codon:yes stop_codon:yes gene_type:complete
MATLTLARGRGNEVARYRRFRLSNPSSSDKTAFILLKRRFETLFNDDDIVYLSNVNAIKHGILATVAEDNADIQRADYHWNVCNALLDQEKSAYRGMVNPEMNLDPFGGSASRVVNML